MATITALLTLIPHEHEQSKTPHLCRALTIAVLMQEPFHLRMRLQRRRFASSARSNPLAEASISRPAALYLSLYPSHHIGFPFNEPIRARLLLGLGIGAGGLDEIFRSVSGENNSGFRGPRAS
jgi:hypothetical protein